MSEGGYLGSYDFSKGCLVLLERIELSTSPLPRECSTTELPQLAFRELETRGFCHTGVRSASRSGA